MSNILDEKIIPDKLDKKGVYFDSRTKKKVFIKIESNKGFMDREYLNHRFFNTNIVKELFTL